MFLTSPKPKVVLVDTEESLDNLLQDLEDPPSCSGPSFFLDLEGNDLGRWGTLSIITLYIRPKNQTYLIDVHKLGKAAFAPTRTSKASIKEFLEDPWIEKVIFDVRSDSDALFSHFKISLDGIQDLQLMELARRRGSKKFVSGLAKCIEKDGQLGDKEKAEFKKQKENMKPLFDFGIFEQRPLTPKVIQYCAEDVVYLPVLHDYYDPLINPTWRYRVTAATKERIRFSQSETFPRKSREFALGPWRNDGSLLKPETPREPLDMNAILAAMKQINI